MIQTFLKGLIFGAGFSIAMVLVSVASIPILNYFTSEPEPETLYKSDNWHSLSDDQQIAQASVLLIGRYEPGPDGSQIGYVAEIHGDADSISMPLVKGDEIPNSKFYPGEHEFRTGLILLYSDNGQVAKRTLYLYDDRVSGFGNMPLTLLVSKFKQGEV
ncbi:hypothetical protein A3709_13230 [Halioglobus sp. HI00S01]|uniref:hypothetical protein n=1 Tax=Halioglobus sp. HI00S01 TaxID=1822214 RepID=UPI0007C3BAF1|nr:hypothetical protein [Halioglobus sp. HI00S01]KZX60247.1 hypothetical protein A3709_13230 [Halioglobus sp. HI00S01]